MTDVDSALEAIRTHSVSSGPDYVPQHYPAPRRPLPAPAFEPFNPANSLEDLEGLLNDLDGIDYKLSEADFVWGGVLRNLEEWAPLWHPDVVACFGPPQ